MRESERYKYRESERVIERERWKYRVIVRERWRGGSTGL